MYKCAMIAIKQMPLISEKLMFYVKDPTYLIKYHDIFVEVVASCRDLYLTSVTRSADEWGERLPTFYKQLVRILVVYGTETGTGKKKKKQKTPDFMWLI